MTARDHLQDFLICFQRLLDHMLIPRNQDLLDRALQFHHILQVPRTTEEARHVRCFLIVHLAFLQLYLVALIQRHDERQLEAGPAQSQETDVENCWTRE